MTKEVIDQAIAALKAAKRGNLDHAWADEAITAIEALAKQPAPVQHEPVAWYKDEDGIRIYYESKVWDDATPLYTSPPQRTLVGLTVEEIEDCYGGEINDFARAIKAKLKEKNT